MAPEEIFSQLDLRMVFKLTTFASNLFYFTWMNPDPYLEYGSWSTKLLNTDPIWIRIHNTVFKNIQLFRTVLYAGVDRYLVLLLMIRSNLL